MKKFDFNNDQTLKEIFDMLHDSYFEMNQMEYNPSTKQFIAFFERENPEKATYKKILFIFKKIIMPLIKCKIVIDNVENLKIEDKSKIEIFSFSEAQITNSNIELIFNEDMKMYLHINGNKSGFLQDLENLKKECMPTYVLDLFGKLK